MLVLPTPPSREEKYLYCKTNKYPFYVFGISSFVLLITGMWLFSLSSPAFYMYGVFAFAATFYLGISYVVALASKDFNQLDHAIGVVKRWSNRDDYPTVDVYLPCCGEDLGVLSNTYMYVNEMVKSWDQSKIKVYVLDDGKSDDVKTLSDLYGFNYIRRDKNEMKKAGNLRNAFRQTDGEFILILDADFAPRFDFLYETIHYFEDDKIAIVQTPQFFSVSDNQTWIEKGAGYIQELFYRMIQVNRNHFNGSICVGTCAVYRRKALEPFGGTAEIGYSEDVHTGFNCIKTGWKIKYIPINLSKGVCPNTLPSFFIQQYRWAMGSLTLFMNKDFWKSNISAWQRVCYLSGMLYYSVTGFSIFMGQIPAMLLVWLAPQHVFWYNAFFSIPSFIFGIFIVGAWTKAPFGWYAPKVRMVSYFSHLFALIDKLRGTLVPWQASGSVKTVKRFEDFRSLMFWWVSISTGMILAGVFYNSHSYGFVNFMPMTLFAIYNYWLCMTILRDQ